MNQDDKWAKFLLERGSIWKNLGSAANPLKIADNDRRYKIFKDLDRDTKKQIQKKLLKEIFEKYLYDSTELRIPLDEFTKIYERTN